MENENRVEVEEFEAVDVFQYNNETGIITQVETVAIDSDPVIRMMVHQANIDYAVLSIIFLIFLMYLISWGAKLWSR